MQLTALNSDFTIVNILNPINIQWSRKYYECGNFSIQLKAVDYDATMLYVYCKDRDEMGIVQKIEYSNPQNGKFIQLSGMFLEKLLDDKIVHPIFNCYGNIEVKIREMVTTYKDDIPLLQLGTLSSLGSTVQFQETGMQLGLKCYEVLATQQLSYRCKYDYIANKINFEIYQGLNRTQSQSTNNYIVFSTSFRNLIDPNVVVDSSNYKNYAVVGGSGEGVDRIIQNVDLSAGGYRKKIFIDQKNTTYNSSEQTLADYKNELYQAGLEKLLDYQIINNVIFDVATANLEYLVDYNLGDRCDIIIDDLNLSLEARIISIYEVLKENQHTITLEFGNKILTNFEKARLDK